MPWNLQIDIPFMTGYLGYIMNLIKINGVPLYLIALAFVAIAWFCVWVGYLVQQWIDRFGSGG